MRIFETLIDCFGLLRDKVPLLFWLCWASGNSSFPLPSPTSVIPDPAALPPPWFHLRSLCSGKPPYILHLSPHSWNRGLLSGLPSLIYPRRVVDFLGILAFYFFIGSDDFYASYVQKRKLEVTYIFFQGHFFLSLNCASTWK